MMICTKLNPFIQMLIVLVKCKENKTTSFLCVKIVILHSDLDAAWMVDTAAVHIGVMDALKFHI